jgi:acetyl esterase/lipase
LIVKLRVYLTAEAKSFMRNPLQSFALLVLVCCPVAFSQQPAVIKVWPGKAPGDTGEIGEEKWQPAKPKALAQRLLTNVTEPSITVYRPAKDKDTGAAVVICPGGGYNLLAMDLEGEEVAAWLTSIGVTGIVLKYRVPRRKDVVQHKLPLADAQRALSVVRSRAKEWGIDPRRIGMLGFSAGGHLAAAAATNYAKRAYDPIDETDTVLCRPDFVVLVYPAYLAAKDGRLNPELRVNSRTPPTFLVHASNDPISPANSVAFYQALRRSKVPAELHLYTSGRHGFGLRQSNQPCSTWPQRCETWLRSRGILQKQTN